MRIGICSYFNGIEIMENLVFKEKIGDYTIIKNGEISVYNDELSILNL